MADVPVKAAFDELGIEWKVKEHPVAPTVEDGLTAIGEWANECSFAKNLFFSDKKLGNILFTVTATRKVDPKKISGFLGLSSVGNFRFASAEKMTEMLGVQQGSVSPLAVMNDKANKVTLVLDKELMSASMVGVHPCRNDMTNKISPADLIKFCQHFGHDPKVLDLGSDVVGSTPSAPAAPKAPKEPKPIAKDAGKKENADEKGLTFTKEGNFPKWYEQIIIKSEMIDFYDISGCYILRPWAYSIWEAIQAYLDGRIKTLNVQNCYFPIFVSEARLNAEKDHVEGFAPEVAWVTKSGDGMLDQPIAIRPTSETIMYPAFANWIRSHRDLPLKLNQWNNVVRWEFKHPTPFLRTREFLWQEGHTAHASLEEADVEVKTILGYYAGVYEELLAVPVIKGKKTEKEKFAGGFYTTTVEAYIPGTGRAIQGATSHCLGQNFGKMFKIEYEDSGGKKAIPWQNSWGLTTRTIGVMVMVHSDDQGLVLPPRVAPLQVVIIPINLKKELYEQQKSVCHELAKTLEAAGVRVRVDDRDNYNPGWKYNYWELKGIPLRVELGPKDFEKQQVRLVRRDTNEKLDIAWSIVPQQVALTLVKMQHEMLTKATAERDANLVRVTKWEDFVPALAQGKLCLTPFCDELEEEEAVKARSKAEALAASGEQEDERCATSVAAKTLCIPYDQPEGPLPPCFATGKPAKAWVLWGRSY